MGLIIINNKLYVYIYIYIDRYLYIYIFSICNPLIQTFYVCKINFGSTPKIDSYNGKTLNIK